MVSTSSQTTTRARGRRAASRRSGRGRAVHRAGQVGGPVGGAEAGLVDARRGGCAAAASATTSRPARPQQPGGRGGHRGRRVVAAAAGSARARRHRHQHHRAGRRLVEQPPRPPRPAARRAARAARAAGAPCGRAPSRGACRRTPPPPRAAPARRAPGPARPGGRRPAASPAQAAHSSRPGRAQPTQRAAEQQVDGTVERRRGACPMPAAPATARLNAGAGCGCGSADVDEGRDRSAIRLITRWLGEVDQRARGRSRTAARRRRATRPASCSRPPIVAELSDGRRAVDRRAARPRPAVVPVNGTSIATPSGDATRSPGSGGRRRRRSRSRGRVAHSTRPPVEGDPADDEHVAGPRGARPRPGGCRRGRPRTSAPACRSDARARRELLDLGALDVRDLGTVGGAVDQPDPVGEVPGRPEQVASRRSTTVRTRCASVPLTGCRRAAPCRPTPTPAVWPASRLTPTTAQPEVGDAERPARPASSAGRGPGRRRSPSRSP